MTGPLARALAGLREYPLPAFATSAAVAAVLLLTGAFLLVLLNLSSVLDRWGKDVQVSCYLQEGTPDETVFALKAELEALPEVAEVTYVSKAEALERFGSSVEGLDRILADLDSNPLPASLEVRLHEQWQSPEQVRPVLDKLRRPAFEELDYSREWVERFHTFVSLLRLSALVLGLLLAAAVVFLVSNTIRLAIYARRDELEVIRLVGGSRWFGRVPFLLEGTLQGLVGGLLALGLLALLHRYAFVRLQAGLGMLLEPELLRFLPPPAAIALVLAGAGVGLLGAWVSVVQTAEEAS